MSSMRQTALLYSSDYGQTIRLYTYEPEVASATGFTLKLKRQNDGTTATLSGTYVSGNDNYPVDVVIPDGWLADKAGRWDGHLVVTWSNAEVHSQPITLVVESAIT